MTNAESIDKILLRLNKLYSQDYNDIDLYKITEAVNKAIDDLVRRLIKGNNTRQEGDEESSVRVDDLAILLKSSKLSVQNKDIFVEIAIPTDYRYYKRLAPVTSKNGCNNVTIKSLFLEEANVGDYLSDYNSQPSFDFEETFHTEVGNNFRVYHNKDFSIDFITLIYYRNPIYIDLEKDSPTNIWEFKDDLCEVIVDEAVKILAGDTENVTAHQLAEKRVEQNN